ncbi:hypothetical protein EDB92DRAFT_1847629 [Lactarius akahatsu]|uniref:Uncharacterized protein n=1 Tax=Lactarius akahatsu TaxID=416441 RepID=A0AAD4LL21_9AGAM|nr:hypothetical protein EDB92DRAFT_1847629 [Lactarius akahatsu]
MASVQPVQAVAERPDIHKSCKALEVVVNLLDDYSEAARAIVTLHKKLAKALREVSTVKPTGDIPGNAFSKFADKQCDDISTEVKEMVKKACMPPQKEEKLHDEKIANANMKIKQAGQVYEKKAKKNAVDVAEEHNRYINLLNTLGPEISQMKYNHALSVAATLSRVAEAEWLRSAERIRRFSPLIGQLGEWKALCEGGWTGPIPGDLPDVDQSPDAPRATQDACVSSPASPRPMPAPSSLRAVPLKPPPTVYDDGSVRSIASLGSFPEPPNHFPIPPLTGSFSSNSATNSHIIQHGNPLGDRTMQIRTSSDVSGSSSDPPSILPRVTESPLEEIASVPIPTDGSDYLAPPPTTSAPNGKSASSSVTEGPRTNVGDTNDAPSLPSPNPAPLRDPPPASVPPPPTLVPVSTQLRQQQDPAPSIDSRSSSVTGYNNTFRRGDYLDDREFGVDNSTEATPLKAKTLDSPQSRIERSDTSRSNGNMVAAIRDRYTRATGPASPPPRDIPRLPLSVATIATKYQSESSNESTGRQSRSPTNDPPHRSRDPGPASPLPQQAQQFPSVTPGRTEFPIDDLSRRRQRIEELEELERREHVLELRAREREFSARQRERAETLRSGALDGYASDTSRSNQPPYAHRQQSQASLQSHPHTTTLSSNYSYSTTSLLPPGPSGPTSPPMQRVTKDVHRPDCQCPACTVARYAEKPLTAHPRPQGREKSKGGWMRRLSMPVVGNAFSSESKKVATVGGKGAIHPTVLGSLGEANQSAVSLGRR